MCSLFNHRKPEGVYRQGEVQNRQEQMRLRNCLLNLPRVRPQPGAQGLRQKWELCYVSELRKRLSFCLRESNWLFLPKTLFEIKVLEHWIQLTTSLGTLGNLTCCVLHFPLQITSSFLSLVFLPVSGIGSRAAPQVHSGKYCADFTCKAHFCIKLAWNQDLEKVCVFNQIYVYVVSICISGRWQRHTYSV